MNPWESIDYDTAVLVPHTDSVYFAWVNSLIRLRIPQPAFFTFQSGLTIDQARELSVDTAMNTPHYNKLFLMALKGRIKYIEKFKTKDESIEYAIDSGAKYIFFLDSDVAVEPDAIYMLKSARFPIVSGVYYKKVNEKITNLYMFNKTTKDYSPITSYETPRYLYVDGVGLGITLIDSDIFRKLSQPWFEWYHYKKYKHAYSEDLNFCLKVQNELGIKILVDTFVKGYHIGVFAKDYEGKIVTTGV
jgi:hypothetical protein